MRNETTTVFQKYPQLATLRGKVPEDVVEREVAGKAPRFAKFSSLAQQTIPTVRLSDVFPRELEQGRIVLENFLGQWGNITVEEVCKIALIAAWLKPRSVFEFGTYNGMTTRQIALNAPPNARIYTLDIPSDVASELEIEEIDRHLAKKTGAFEFEVGHYFKGTSVAHKITQLWGDSTKTDLSAYHEQMDLVFIDAAHAYSYVKADTENALKMLRPGGVLLWHDYLQILSPDVSRCLYEYASSGVAIRHLRGTSLAVFYRKP